MSEFDLLVARGTSLQNPVTAAHFRKAPAPLAGDKYGSWNNDYQQYRLPGGSVMTFDLNRLTLDDFRQMRHDYQLNASLMILTGMMAQSDWTVYTKGQETDAKAQKISDVLEEGIRRRWLSLIRAWHAALWSGFAPTVLVYDLNRDGYYEVVKYKDLIPEDCRVNWEQTILRDGTRIKKYNGIINMGRTIPAENTLWYPMLMENGDYYGRKLLKPAFGPWFFSQLIHLYTNRYFERFGEPTAIGRYPGDTTINNPDGTSTSAREVMTNLLMNLRSRGVVTLPSDTDPETNQPEWAIEYLESQMRGADFDRYLDRLDEEKSLALFTPVLMFRTGSRGSYALGEIHTDVFEWMLNMLALDFKVYLDEYLITPLHDINFGPNAPRSEIRFRTLGRISNQGAQSTLTALIQNGGAKVTPKGLKDLGDFLGIDLEYLTGMADTPTGPGGDNVAPTTQGPTQPPTGPSPNQNPALGHPVRTQAATDALRNARGRLGEQVAKGFSMEGDERDAYLMRVRLGFKGQFVDALGGTPEAEAQFAATERGVLDAIREADSADSALAAVDDIIGRLG